MRYEVTMILEYPEVEGIDRIRHEVYKGVELGKLTTLIPDHEKINVLSITARHIPMSNRKRELH